MVTSWVSMTVAALTAQSGLRAVLSSWFPRCHPHYLTSSMCPEHPFRKACWTVVYCKILYCINYAQVLGCHRLSSGRDCAWRWSRLAWLSQFSDCTATRRSADSPMLSTACSESFPAVKSSTALRSLAVSSCQILR